MSLVRNGWHWFSVVSFQICRGHPVFQQVTNGCELEQMAWSNRHMLLLLDKEASLVQLTCFFWGGLLLLSPSPKKSLRRCVQETLCAIAKAKNKFPVEAVFKEKRQHVYFIN